MEENTNKKQEKTKKEAAQKQAADLKTKVPEPAKPSPSPLHHPTTCVTLPQASHPPSSSSSVRTNGKRAPPSTQQTPQQQTPPQPPSSSSGPRYPPREVPPRFRQQEHKQLLKRGQPLPAGALSSLTVTPASNPLTPGAPASSSSSAGKRHTDLPFQSGPGAQYENPHWGALPPATDRSSTTSSSWDQVIIDGSDTEAWPSISRSSDSRPANPSECATAADYTNPETSSNMSMAAGATSQQAHYPSLKANVTNVASMMQPGGGQGVGAIGSRGWGSGSGPITMAPTEGAKPDGLGPNMGRSGRAPGWNSQSSFSLNLNPNANPSAWPVLGQEGAGDGPNPASLPPNGSLGNGSLGGDENNSSSTWGGMMSPDAPSSNKNVSFSSMEHSNLNTEGQNSHHTKQPLSPIHGLPGWGGQSPTESSQLNGDAGSSVWGNGDTKTSADSSSKNSGWDSAPSGGMSGWGHSGSGGGASGGGEGGWGGDWGKPSSGEAKGGWDSSDGPAQDQQVSSWGQPIPAPTSEGSGSGGSEGRSHRRDRTGSEDGGPPPLPRQDLDPRVLCNTGWGQTPVRQHTSWEMEEQRAANERKTSEMRGGGGGDTWRGSSPSSGSPPDPRNGGANPNLGPSQRPGSGGSGGKSEGPSGWGGPPPSGWGEQPVNKAPNGSVSGWGEPMAQGHNTTNNGPKSGVQSWGVPEGKSSPTWDDGPAKTQQNQSQSWGEGPKSSHGWGSGHGSGSRGSNGSNGSNGGEWREPAEVKKNGSSSHMWEGEGGNGREGGGWKDSTRGGGGNGGGWASKPASAVGGGGWGETQHPNSPAPGWGSKPQESPNGPAPGWGSKPQESPNGPAPGWGSKPQESPNGPAPGWGSKPQESPNGPAPGWGSKPQESPNGPAPGWGSKPQESPNGNSGGVGTGGGSMGSWGGPASVRQSSNPGWGPGSSVAKPDPAMEPTGWEEPSPPSIRRKMEIDDGTSTWGDPSAYNKTVNMWDRNNPTGGNGNQGNNPTQPPTSKSNGGMAVNSHNHSSVPPSNNNHHHMNHHHPHHGQPPPHSQHHGNNNGSPNTAAPHQGGGPQGRPPMANPGWGELPSVQQPKPEPAWGEPAGPSPAVDNGTSAWGKPPGVPGGWGDGGHGGHEPNGPYRRGNNGPSGPAPCKPAPKSMQDGWGGGREEEMGMSSGQWDADAGDMWNSPASQESSSSCNSWGQPPKKGPPKGKMGNQPDEAWIMNRLIKQLTDMGFPRDPAEEALKSNNMNLDQAMSALLEKKTELDKRGMGMSDYNNGMNKPLGCRPQALSKDPSSDRSPFLDKDGGLSDDAPPSPFLPSPVSLKLPLVNNLQPGLALGSPGLNMQNLNNRQMQSGMLGSSGAALSRAMQQQPPQPSVPPLGSSQPSLRAQVPQFLTPQVQAQLLQFAAKNIGLNPALLTSPINPQQMTLLYQLQQLQMAYQRLQIQQQMMQAQRNVSGPIRQQEQQVARTINNMQQQIQQHQRQLYQALLMKQQPPGSHSGLHPGQGKSALDSFPGHPQAPGLSDLHTKEPQSSPNSYSPYPLSGLNPNMNVNCMEVGGLSMKEPPQPQSRLSQWTHPNSMDSLSGNSSHMEANLNKHGAISAASNLGPPGKPPHMDDSYSPYSMMGGSESPTSPLVPPDSWGQGPGKSPKDQITNGTNINWPPEFCPGVPWKGLQNIDPENDPNMTPGSVPSGPTINTNIQDVNRYLLRDRSGGSSPPSPPQNGALPPSTDWPVSGCYTSSFSLSSPDEECAGKLSDMKSTWSPGPISHPSQASLSHELWKVPQGPRNNTAPSRPPPGLTNPAKPSSTWGGNSLGLAQGWSSSYTSEGTTWSTDSSNRTSSWLVLRNLTPQIDGSTLRTLCMQHGPLITFHLFLTQGNAVVRYSSKEEAAKAQKSLHMCVLGNTTILAEFAGEEEVNRYFAQGQQQLPPTTSWQPNPGTNQTRMGGGGGSQQHAIGHHWSSGGGGLGGGAKTGGGGDLLWGGVPQYSSLWGPPSGDDSRGVIGSPNPINTLLPGDLLSGESM